MIFRANTVSPAFPTFQRPAGKRQGKISDGRQALAEQMLWCRQGCPGVGKGNTAHPGFFRGLFTDLGGQTLRFPALYPLPVIPGIPDRHGSQSGEKTPADTLSGNKQPGGGREAGGQQGGNVCGCRLCPGFLPSGDRGVVKRQKTIARPDTGDTVTGYISLQGGHTVHGGQKQPPFIR